MSVKVGINGFGRIGRIVLRTCLQNPYITVVAINDPAIDAEYICYLIKFDSTHGKFKGIVLQDGDDIKVDDQTIKVFNEKLPTDVPWQTADVQYVVEASGLFTNLEKASGHLASDGVKRVIVTAPSVDVPMIIIGVNEEKLKPVQKVISCASSTLYCLAPVIKLLDDHFGVADGFITSIHAMTPSLKPLDGLCVRGKHWRDHRSIHQNIIPAITGACKALGKILPQVKDKMTGLAFRVPIINVSVLDITIRLNMNTSIQEIVKIMDKASKLRMQNIIKITEEEAVSSDFIGDSHSCILDVKSSLQLKPNFFKLICWYENEYSYACRVINSIMLSEKQFCELSSKVTYVRPRSLKKQDVVSQTENSKRESASNCCPEVDSKLRNFSQDTGLKRKPLQRQAILRKPCSPNFSGNNRAVSQESKKKNEMFKIWNDSTNEKFKPETRQNRSAFFQSCVYIAQNAEKSNCKRAQARLENVKREFTKMITITEDLLKKSYDNKIKQKSQLSLPKDFSYEHTENKDGDINEQKYINVGSENDHKSDTTSKISMCQAVCFEKSNNLAIPSDNYNVGESKHSNHNCDVNKLDYCSLTIDKTNAKLNRTSAKVDFHKKQIKKSYDKIQVTGSNLYKIEKSAVVGNNGITNEKDIKEKGIFKEQVEKIVNTLIDGLSQNAELSVDSNPKVETSRTFIDKKENSIKDATVTNHLHSSQVKSEIKFNYSEESNNIKNCDNTKSVPIENKPIVNHAKVINEQKDYAIVGKTELTIKESKDIRTIREELKKRNITLVDTHKEVINIGRKPKVFNFESDGLVVKPNCYKEMDLKKEILSDLGKSSSKNLVIIPKEIPRYDSMDSPVTLNDGDGNRLNEDIYDKLDSASATDSNNSFEMYERKSQVLQMSDLTNSVEDLTRLDKICRILEISDELSDQLFSTLDKGDNAMKTKKWSFKDLCERIKLDDFCSKVFEKRIS